MVRGLASLLVLGFALGACGGGGSPTGDDCRDGETRPCYRGTPGTEDVGPCKAGVETCSGGTWPGVCVGDVVPFVEKCNGIDDNCDGVVDNVAGAGGECSGANGCAGARACGPEGALVCVSPPRNECGLCDGPTVDGLGLACMASGCTGQHVCASDQVSTICNAPAQNECGVCGGPPVQDLGSVCMATSGCAGQLACNPAGTAAVCDCSANIRNDNGTIRPIIMPAAGDLVITEVMPSPSKVADAVGEWFEVLALADFDLNNLGLDRAGDTAQPNILRAYDCVRVTAGTRLVFARNADPAMNGGIPASAIAGTFTFSLVAGSQAVPGDVRVLAGATVVDAITWTSSTNGRALQLDPDAHDPVANDDAANFCNAITPYGDGDLGTPGAANVHCLGPGECYAGATPRAIVTPTGGQLVISEIMPNALVEPAQEWFEITNVGAASFDLNGLALDRPGDNIAPNAISSTTCMPVAPNAYVVFARNADPALNGGLPGVAATFTFSMVNSNGGVQVVDPTSCATTTPFACTTIFDAVTYTTTTSGVSRQVRPDKLTTVDNDDAASWCPGIATYGPTANLGSPGAPNTCN